MKWVRDIWTSKCMEYDKWTHAGGSCLITIVVFFCVIFFTPLGWFMNALLAGGISFVAGLALEFWQGYHPDGLDGFSWKDLVANVVGILFAMAAVIL
jgi:hypothetical protein